MKIFALDSSTAAASAAICEDTKPIAESYADVGLTHSETLMEICDEVFRRTKLKPADIDCFAVSCGPGSFTGLRIGIGTIKGFAFAASKPCAAVPTLLALAANCRMSERLIVPVIDARKKRVYTAFFEPTTLERLSEDAILTLDELGEKLKALSRRVIFVGDGAAMCYNYLYQKLDAIAADAQFLLPRAASIAFCAERMAAQGDIVDASSLKPVYLQPSQAERERLEKLKQE